MRIGGEEMLSWGGADPEQTLQALLQAVALLLTPEAGDSASLGIGEVRLLSSLHMFAASQLSLLSAASFGKRLSCELLHLPM